MVSILLKSSLLSITHPRSYTCTHTEKQDKGQFTQARVLVAVNLHYRQEGGKQCPQKQSIFIAIQGNLS